MSDKTNDEKLRILQERLAQIKHKQDSPGKAREQMTTNSFNLSKKEESDKEYQKSGFSLEKKGTSFSLTKENSHSLNPNIEDLKREEKPLASSWIKKIVIVGSVAYGCFYGYTNIDFNSLTPNFSLDVTKEELLPNNQLEYDLDLKGENIAIVSTPISITDEGSAKAMVNDLKVKGFKCDYIYLPEHSNSTDEVYQIFIGPYENKEETNQWAKNLEAEFNVITL